MTEVHSFLSVHQESDSSYRVLITPMYVYIGPVFKNAETARTAIDLFKQLDIDKCRTVQELVNSLAGDKHALYEYFLDLLKE